MTLKWEDNTLYGYDDRSMREVGYVQRSPIGEWWDVYVGGEWLHTLNTLEAARHQLEAYAQQCPKP